MNESVGNAFLFNLVISIIIILLTFFIGSMSYSKASKVKNKIIEEIEKQGEYENANFRYQGADIYNNAEDEITNWLGTSGIGYKKNNRAGQSSPCREDDGDGGILINQRTEYEYCIYLHSTCTSDSNKKCGEYFTVVAYMYFDIPVIQDFIKIPVKGETMTFSQITS